jgi:hypothetical protein
MCVIGQQSNEGKGWDRVESKETVCRGRVQGRGEEKRAEDGRRGEKRGGGWEEDDDDESDLLGEFCQGCSIHRVHLVDHPIHIPQTRRRAIRVPPAA